MARATIRPRLRDRLAVSALLALWIVPVAYLGIVSPRLAIFPDHLVDLQSIACLFSRKPTSWASFYVEGQFSERGPWLEIDERAFFPMEPFGHRTRLHRFLILWGPKGGKVGRAEVAQFIVDHWRERWPAYWAAHPPEAADASIMAIAADAPPPLQIRFRWYWSAPDPARPPSGRWHDPDLRRLPPNRVKVLSIHAPSR